MKTTVGFLSGSGPEAGLYMCHRLHTYLQKQYHAVQDQDYIDYVLYNRPLQGFDETGIADFDTVLHDFKKAIGELESMGVSYIGIACNTLHVLLDFVDERIQQKIINMVDVTVQTCIKKNVTKVLLLGSYTTNVQCLYDSYCKKRGISYVKVSTNEQKMLDMIIEKVMGATQTQDDAIYLNYLISSYIGTENIDGFILGCTELPLAFLENKTGIHCFNANDILVECLVDSVKKKK